MTQMSTDRSTDKIREKHHHFACVSLFICLTLCQACGQGDGKTEIVSTDCGGKAGSSANNAPQILAFNFLYNHPEDSWLIVSSITFSDQDGDLGSGRVDVFINDATEPTLATELQDDFISYFDTTQQNTGEVPLLLSIKPQTSSPDIELDGRRIRLSIQLIDGSGLKSHCAAMSLQMAVSSSDT
jgi:hypothetical protein